MSKLGIIESDDIKKIQQEIDKAVDFSKKASELVENIKRKAKPTNQSESESETELEKCEEVKPVSRPCPPPKQNLLSLQRMVTK